MCNKAIGQKPTFFSFVCLLFVVFALNGVNPAFSDMHPLFYGYWDHEAGPEDGSVFLDYVNIGKSLSVGAASSIVEQGIEVIPMVAGFNAEMTREEWRKRLSDQRSRLRAIHEDVRFVLLIDEPYGKGFSVEQLDQIIDDARDIIDDPAEDINFRYGYTFTTTTIRWRDDWPLLPRNADLIGINNYPFREEGGVADTQTSFDADMNALLSAAREKKASGSQIFLVGQAFFGGRWREPPPASALWYAQTVRNEEDVEGLLWYEWRSRGNDTGSGEMPALVEQQVLAYEIIPEPGSALILLISGLCLLLGRREI